MVKEQANIISGEDVAELLRNHGITPTQQRVEVAQFLFAKRQHLSAEQILCLANHGASTVSKATVYNTLALFVQQGLVREVTVDPTRVFYDSNSDGHHHFYNVDTGQLTDIEAEQVTIGQLPSLPKGTVAAGVEVIIRVRNQGQ
jgi:Fur family iron response transcriptional regulator